MLNFILLGSVSPIVLKAIPPNVGKGLRGLDERKGTVVRDAASQSKRQNFVVEQRSTISRKVDRKSSHLRA